MTNVTELPFITIIHVKNPIIYSQARKNSYAQNDCYSCCILIHSNDAYCTIYGSGEKTVQFLIKADNFFINSFSKFICRYQFVPLTLTEIITLFNKLTIEGKTFHLDHERNARRHRNVSTVEFILNVC